MCDNSHGPGTSESVRIAHLRECVEPLAPPPDLHIDICADCRDAPHGTRTATTPSEHHRTLERVIKCPSIYKNTTLGGHCGLIVREHHEPVDITLLESYSTTAPHGLYQYRVFDRIRGIEEITQLVRTQSSSEVTARRREALERIPHQRHAEHFRKYPPPPPCRVRQTGPQPGVPTAPDPPCNLGNQRVDYSNPRH